MSIVLLCRLIWNFFSVKDGGSRNTEGGWRDNQEFGVANWRKALCLLNGRRVRNWAKPKAAGSGVNHQI